MDQRATRREKDPLTRQAAAGLALMLAFSAALLFLAWLTVPVPLVKDTVQTELLYVQVYRSPGEPVTWHPVSIAEQQTARAVVDYMGTCRERNTLRPAEKAMAGQPRMQVYFRTEDTYRVVNLGSWSAGEGSAGWAGDQDQTGCAAKVLDPEALTAYILGCIGEDLPHIGWTSQSHAPGVAFRLPQVGRDARIPPGTRRITAAPAAESGAPLNTLGSPSGRAVSEAD